MADLFSFSKNCHAQAVAGETWVVFSDIHSNLEAFQAVLADLATVRFTRMMCLGDVVGYAASPKDCLDLLRTLETQVLLGNHDFAVVNDAVLGDMRGPAVAGIQFAREQLSAARRDFLADLPLMASEGDLQFVHSSLDHAEAWTYLRREAEIRAHFTVQTRPICFCGHTHIPGVFWWKEGDIESLGTAGRIGLPDHGKILINAGSIGQPRDRNPDACYVLYESGARTVEFRRVSYDIAAAQSRIYDADLPRVTGERLSLGQ